MLAEDTETIVAISTPAGLGGRGIVRLSGAEALDIAERVFDPSDGLRLRGGATYTANAGQLDLRAPLPAWAYVMRAPHSYTREDVVEIHTAGSAPILQEIVDAFIRAGARYARPGEFTRRAFLHGRLDLSQAEAVLQIIRSRTDADLRTGMNLLSGALSQNTRRILRQLTETCAHVEACIDFSDQDIDPMDEPAVRAAIRGAIEDLSRLCDSTGNGMLPPCEISAVLHGRPNVGKSSLMNALVKQERALVSTRPGTTRDVVTHQFSESGVRFQLLDTAGLAKPDGSLSRQAIEKAQQAAAQAHLILLVFDAVQGLTAQDECLFAPLASKQALLVANKVDLLPDRRVCRDSGRLNSLPMVLTSALTGEGIPALRAQMAQVVLDGNVDRSSNAVALNARHRRALADARRALRRALQNARGQLELIAADLREAMDSLGEITGVVTTEDVLDRIFSAFCVGK